ncbi:MAG: hypothetical protein OEW11_05995 [Nitrospirota bacterium]|nr:hypothetical protein [Nitrospirota bacterium]
MIRSVSMCARPATLASLAVASLSALLWAVPAEAKKFVYSPIVHEGEKELEYYVDWYQDAADRTTAVNHEVEVVNVLAEHDKLSLYGVWEDRSKGGELNFVRYKIEWIHQIFEHNERSWDAGFYLEYQIQDDPTGVQKADKIEFKPLLAKSVGKTEFRFNGVLEKELGVATAGATTPGAELGYAAQVSLQARPVQPMLEVFGSLGEVRDLHYSKNRQLIGPVFKVGLGRRLVWEVGALFGTTPASEDVRIKSNLALEWY